MIPAKPRHFYHGTSIEAALRIQETGFRVDLAGTNAGALLGAGVYCTTSMEKALHYAKRMEAEGVVFELDIDLGRCKELQTDDSMMRTWQEHGYDSAWAPKGANSAGLEENCVKDPARIRIVNVFAGHTGKLLAMGMTIKDGRLVMISDSLQEVSPQQDHAPPQQGYAFQYAPQQHPPQGSAFWFRASRKTIVVGLACVLLICLTIGISLAISRSTAAPSVCPPHSASPPGVYNTHSYVGTCVCVCVRAQQQHENPLSVPLIFAAEFSLLAHALHLHLPPLPAFSLSLSPSNTHTHTNCTRIRSI